MPTTNGSYEYRHAGAAGAPGEESVFVRRERERFWTSLRKKIQKGAKVRTY